MGSLYFHSSSIFSLPCLFPILSLLCCLHWCEVSLNELEVRAFCNWTGPQPIFSGGVGKTGGQGSTIVRARNIPLRVVELPNSTLTSPFPSTMVFYESLDYGLRPHHPPLDSSPERPHIFLWQIMLKISLQGPAFSVHVHMGSEGRVYQEVNYFEGSSQSVTLNIAQGPCPLFMWADWSFASHQVTVSLSCFILPFNLTSSALCLPIFT